MLENPDNNFLNENTLTADELEQVTGGKGPHRNARSLTGKNRRAWGRACGRLEEEADASARAEADGRLL